MNLARRRPSRVIVFAIVLSLAVHAMLLPFVHARAAAQTPQAQPSAVMTLHHARPTPRPTPVPPRATPRPVVVRPAIVPPRAHLVAVTPPRLHRSANAPFARASSNSLTVARGDRGPSAYSHSVPVSGSAGPPGTTESPQSEATPFSTPDPIASKGCPAPPHDAIVTQAVTPDRPQSAVNEDAVGRVVVEVRLTRDGSVADASVRASSGFAALDRAAVGAATQARYAPASDGCEAIAGTYLYVVDFSE